MRRTVLTVSVGLGAIVWSEMTMTTPMMMPTPAPNHGICSSAGKLRTHSGICEQGSSDKEINVKN